MATQLRDLSIDGFERVVELRNPAAGLHAFVAMHSLALGPALGGARLFNYASREAAIRDVCNLARGMSYKNALAGIPFGGGKAVLIGKSGAKSDDQLLAFAEGLNALNGAYLSAEDSGISPADMAVMATSTPYVAGLEQASGGGNPAPFTAKGVFLGLQAAIEHRLGRANGRLDGLRIGVEGLGQVGYALARQLRDAGATVIASEINSERLGQAVQELGVVAVSTEQLLDADLDVFAPCALGGAIAADRLRRLRAPVIAGAANNQLANCALGDVLARRNQLYAPDYVINAAGVISIAGEYLGCWSPEWLNTRILRIPERLAGVFERAASAGHSTAMVADRWAREIIRAERAASLPKSA